MPARMQPSNSGSRVASFLFGGVSGVYVWNECLRKYVANTLVISLVWICSKSHLHVIRTHGIPMSVS